MVAGERRAEELLVVARVLVQVGERDAAHADVVVDDVLGQDLR